MKPPEVFYKKGVLKNFAKFTGKHLCQSLFFNKVASLRPTTSLKKRLWHWCLPVNITKCLRTPILKNIYERLLAFLKTSLFANIWIWHFQGIFSKHDHKLISLKTKASYPNHETIIRPGITYKKIPYHMRDSTCRCCLVKSV